MGEWLRVCCVGFFLVVNSENNKSTSLQQKIPSQFPSKNLPPKTLPREYIHRATNWKKYKSGNEIDPMDGPAGASAGAAKKSANPQEANNNNGKEDTTGGSLQNVDAGGAGVAKNEKQHEYEVIVCHMNVIRYFVSRALQLPPETWLRMRGDNCGRMGFWENWLGMRCCFWGWMEIFLWGILR